MAAKVRKTSDRLLIEWHAILPATRRIHHAGARIHGNVKKSCVHITAYYVR